MFSRVKDIIFQQLNLSADTKLTPDMTFDQMSIDSIDAFEIIMAIEDDFGIEIPDDVAVSFKSIADILEYLKSQSL